MTEQELTELREQAEKGRKAKIAQEFLDEFLLQERARILNEGETSDKYMYEDLLFNKIYLIVLRHLENSIKLYTDIGEIAEKELNDGNEK